MISRWTAFLGPAMPSFFNAQGIEIGAAGRFHSARRSPHSAGVVRMSAARVGVGLDPRDSLRGAIQSTTTSGRRTRCRKSKRVALGSARW